MAIRSMSEAGVVSGWNSKMMFPKNRYALRCLSEENSVSKAGNVMQVREWEIIQPEPVSIGDKKVDVDGLKITQYRTIKIRDEADPKEWDKEKSDKAFSAYRDELTLVGFEGSEIDDENPPLVMKGKVVDAIVYGKENKSFQSPTPEQLKKGQRYGDPIKDADGKDVVVYQLQIETILGLSAADVSNRPY